MHIALNAHLLSGTPTYRSAGVHRYIYYLLAHLPRAGCQVTVFAGPHSRLPEDGYAVRRSRWPTAKPPVRVAWEQVVQPWALRRARVDLFHGPVFVGPLLTPCPTVVTIHDLSFLRYPHFFRPANRLYLRTFTRASARRASRIIAVSNHAAEETVRLLGVDRRKIDVVYHGVDPALRPLSPEEVEAFRRREGLPERFVLYVGTLEPRKNLIRLVEAFALLRPATLRPETHLILAGARGWYFQDLFARVEQLGLKDRVIFPGYIPGDRLVYWYNAATGFAYPSLYEGFGMPVVEAQACGTPVLTSNRSALPEAAGEGALLVDPEDVEAIAEGLRRLLMDEPLRAELRQRGLDHAARFTWEKTAAETVTVYRQALAEEGRG
ncbi:MAG TPA: glycosyltransferase family 4 protein [Thermoflexia bacterium]|jgi:glycosyltransferase involved in cell wall biosynthesis|nr:glycosyltransferase family 4 protein [Thermoflexia bacterium]